MALVVTRDGVKTEEQLEREHAEESIKLVCFTCGYVGKNPKCCANPVQIQITTSKFVTDDSWWLSGSGGSANDKSAE
jgi:hypothetical protein